MIKISKYLINWHIYRRTTHLTVAVWRMRILWIPYFENRACIVSYHVHETKTHHPPVPSDHGCNRCYSMNHDWFLWPLDERSLSILTSETLCGPCWEEGRWFILCRQSQWSYRMTMLTSSLNWTLGGPCWEEGRSFILCRQSNVQLQEDHAYKFLELGLVLSRFQDCRLAKYLINWHRVINIQA